jgi:3-oxoacyl-[acyl-carrier protein] reductase
MMRRRRGQILNISSFSGRHGARGQANYAAAKAGLLGFTKSMAHEVGPYNVRVNAILPGVLPTRMLDDLSAEARKSFEDANALGRLNSVEEVARFIVFVAGMENVSGQLFQLDSRVSGW